MSGNPVSSAVRFVFWLPLLMLAAGAIFSLALSAETADLNYVAGIALVKEGKLDQAILAFEEALESDPQNYVVLNATGAAYSLRGDLEKAKGYFLRCLETNPQFVPARKNLAITYFSIGQHDLAATQFQKLSEVSSSSSPIANLFLGMVAGKKGDDEQAAKLLEGAGALLNSYPEAILYLAQADIRLGHSQRAGEVLAKLSAASATAAERRRLAELYSQLGENQKALTILTELAAKSPDSSALNVLAHVAEKSGNLALAIESLRKAAKLDPAREDNYLDFSTICADYGNYPLALEAAGIGLDHIPNSYRLMIQKSVVLENLGQFEEAENTLRRAAGLQKDNSVALLSLAIVQTHAGQAREAETTLISALKDSPDNYYMHYHLGKLLLRAQEANPTGANLNARAKQAFEQAIRCNPSFADSYFQLSKLYLRESSKRAEENLARCLQLDPNHASAEYALARLYLSTGRRAEGQALMDRFERQRQAEKLKETDKPRIELARKEGSYEANSEWRSGTFQNNMR